MRGFGFAEGIVPRIRHNGLLAAVFFAFARFGVVRKLGNAYLKAFRRAQPPAPESVPAPALRTVFCGIDPDAVVEAVERDAWFPNFDLPGDVVDRIVAATQDALLSCALRPELRFTEKEKPAIEQTIGRPIAFAEFAELAESSKEIARLCRDPVLVATVEKYLGRPHVAKPRLLKSFVTQMSDSERMRQKQTIFFHYDLDGFQCLFFNFYLTDTREDTGAHVLVEGSHGSKPMRHLLGTTNVPDEEIAAHYASHRVVRVCGPKGFGFVEDAYCLHKALPPTAGDRLLLQIRCY